MNVPLLLGQHFPGGVTNCGSVQVLAAVHPELPAFDGEGRGQGNRQEVVDLHPAGKGDHVAQLVDLTHGLVKDGGDDAAMSVARRPDEAVLQLKVADKALAWLVENKLQSQAAFVAGTATEAVVSDLLLLYFVTVNAFVLGHGTKMRHEPGKMQAGKPLFAVRCSPEMRLQAF